MSNVSIPLSAFLYKIPYYIYYFLQYARNLSNTIAKGNSINTAATGYLFVKMRCNNPLQNGK